MIKKLALPCVRSEFCPRHRANPSLIIIALYLIS